MGNRAVITIQSDAEFKLGLYLHWNGGRDSVEAFLAYCKLKGYRSPEFDNYGWARLCQVIGNFFGGENSIGFDFFCNLDCKNGDNGVYVIEKWEIIGREYFEGSQQHEYNLRDFLHEINSKMPEHDKLEAKTIDEYCAKLTNKN